jgi:hypothetical protein
VKKKEIRKQGVVSKARRAVTHVEFRRMQSILREKNDVIRRYGILSLLTKHKTGGAVAQLSTLSPNPRSLYLLWDEYENGIGGRKAARLFSREERGTVKDKFHR